MPLKDLLFGFEGRIRRRDWWIWGIGLSVAWIALSVAFGGLLFGSTWAESQFTGAPVPSSWSVTAYGVVTYLPLLWVQSALAAKRAHDRNRDAPIAVGLTILSGLSTFAPEVAILVDASGLTSSQLNILTTTVDFGGLAASLYLLVVLGFLDGTQGPNRFGRSPKGIGGDPADKAAEVFS